MKRTLISCAMATGLLQIAPTLCGDLAAARADLPYLISHLFRQAKAFEFSGRVKRIRIKRRRSGGNYLTVDTTTRGLGATVAPQGLSVQLDGKPTAGTLRRTRSFLSSGPLSFEGPFEAGAWYTFRVEGIGEAQLVTVSPCEATKCPVVPVVTAQGALSAALFVEGETTRLGLRLNGEPLFAASAMVVDWRGPAPLDAELSLTPVQARQRWRLPAEVNNGQHEVRVVLRDGLGTVADVDAYRVDLDTAPRLRSTMIMRDPEGARDAVLIRAIAPLEIAPTGFLFDPHTGARAPLEASPGAVEQQWSAEVAFEEVPQAHESYLVLIDASPGEPNAWQGEVELAFNGASSVTVPIMGDGPDGGLVEKGKLTAQLEGNVGLFSVSLHGETTRIELVFEEPFDGPPPVETNAVMAEEQIWTEWQLRGPGIPGSALCYRVDLGTEGWSDCPNGLDPANGKASGNGKGTRKASPQTAQQAQLELL